MVKALFFIILALAAFYIGTMNLYYGYRDSYWMHWFLGALNFYAVYVFIRAIKEV